MYELHWNLERTEEWCWLKNIYLRKNTYWSGSFLALSKSCFSKAHYLPNSYIQEVPFCYKHFFPYSERRYIWTIWYKIWVILSSIRPVIEYNFGIFTKNMVYCVCFHLGTKVFNIYHFNTYMQYRYVRAVRVLKVRRRFSSIEVKLLLLEWNL